MPDIGASILQLDLLSWNVHAPPRAPRRVERLTAVAAEIARRAPEVALLQEVWFASDAARLTAQLGHNYDVVGNAPRSWPLRTGGLLAFVRRAAGWRADRRAARFERLFWRGEATAGRYAQLELIENAGRDQPFSDHHGLHVRVTANPPR